MPAAKQATPEPNAAPVADEPTGFAVPEGWAAVLFDRGFQLQDEYEAVVKARKANRESLRGLETQGLLSTDEKAVLDEMYPEREMVRRSAEERAAELERKAVELREKAEKDAKAKANGKDEPAAA